MSSSDLIISHCGAGSMLEILRLGKPAVAVVNNALLDNHQVELAEELAKEKHITVAHRPSFLIQTLKSFEWSDRKPFPPVDASRFVHEIHSMLGLVE